MQNIVLEEIQLQCQVKDLIKILHNLMIFSISILGIISLGIIAGSSIWIAQGMYKIISGTNHVRLSLCCPSVNMSSFCMEADICPNNMFLTTLR
tara:strand:- start:185 stop:466 length:282 start_codon:yes stop_codon:yes gene_type:complete